MQRAATRHDSVDTGLQHESGEHLAVDQYAAIVAASSDAIFSTSPAGLVQNWNNGARRIFGFDALEAVGRDIAALILPPDRCAELAKTYAAMAEGRSERSEISCLRKDGTRADVSASFAPIRDDAGAVTAVAVVLRDVGDKQRADADVRENSSFIQTVIDTAPASTYLFNCVTRKIEFISKRGPQLLGYDAVTWNRFGLSAVDLMHPDDVARLPAHFERLNSDPNLENLEFEYRMRHVDGSWRWFVSYDTAYERGVDGALLSVLGMAVDIDQRKRTERQLLAANDTFRQLVDHSPFGIYAVDADFRLVQVSAGAQKVFANVKPLIGRDFAEILRSIWPEPFASEAIAIFRHTLITGEAYRAPRTVERRNDIAKVESYDWKVERLILPDGRHGVVCHFYDLSERLSYEAELLASETKFHGTFETSAVGIAHVALDGSWREVNRKLCEIVGYSRDELVVKTFQEITHPDDLADDLENVGKLLAGALQSYAMDKRYIRKDGTVVWIGLTVALQLDSAGKPQYFISIVRDITHQKQAEDHLNFLLRELVHRSKNQLAIVQAIATQTSRNAPTLADFAKQFQQRIQGMAVATDVLVSQNWSGAPLSELVRRQLEPFHSDGTRLKYDGPNVLLSPDAAQAIGLTLHELATNALKYGAWSSAAGTVTLSWRLHDDSATSRRLYISWKEEGGPLVAPPERRGFGHMVVERMVAQKIDGAVEMIFAPNGLSWELWVPSTHFSEPQGNNWLDNFRQGFRP